MMAFRAGRPAAKEPDDYVLRQRPGIYNSENQKYMVFLQQPDENSHWPRQIFNSVKLIKKKCPLAIAVKLKAKWKFPCNRQHVFIFNKRNLNSFSKIYYHKPFHRTILVTTSEVTQNFKGDTHTDRQQGDLRTYTDECSRTVTSITYIRKYVNILNNG
jgi:hypothetical protein